MIAAFGKSSPPDEAAAIACAGPSAAGFLQIRPLRLMLKKRRLVRQGAGPIRRTATIC